jgi:alpha-ketoglutaric semialdehyde dehydrogenase
MTMVLHPVLVAGAWRPALAPIGSFRAVNPAAGEELEDSYPISCRAEIEEAVRAGNEAAAAMAGLSPEAIATFLESYAAAVEARADDLVRTAHLETGLPVEPRLRSVELPRTVFQLRQAAAASRDRSWRRATIDTKADIRSLYGPLGGPVVVFGPNNFPFAYNSIAGTDFASALAAGNPVIAKAHPCHPGTTRIFAEIAFSVLQSSDLPAAAVQLIYHMAPEDGLALVAHSGIGASAFTGSRPGGLRLKEAADKAGRPIYLEMSSVNPVFLLPGALRDRGEAIAGEMFGSCTLGAGQFCTKPGLIVVPGGEDGDAFIERLRLAFEAAPPQILLARSVLDGITSGLETMVRAGARILAGGRPTAGPGFRFPDTLLRVEGDRFLERPADLQQEAFGPVSLCVTAEPVGRMAAIAAALEGNLTISVFSHSGDEDESLYRTLAPILRTRCGRFLNDKVPTGVAVSPAMVHGGPFPATGHPGFTAVGFPAAMMRFAALHGYDHVRPRRLPPELREANPTGRMMRFIDGEWTTK